MVRSLRHIENGVWWLGVCESRLLRRDGLESFLNREMVGGCRLQRRADSIDNRDLGMEVWREVLEDKSVVSNRKREKGQREYGEPIFSSYLSLPKESSK